MVIITGFWIINGSKSDMIPDNKEIQYKKEMDDYRYELEQKHCYKHGIKVADINFTFGGWVPGLNVLR